MTDIPIHRTGLSRRSVLAAGGALAVGGAVDGDRQAIELGALRFSVPRPYLFGPFSEEAARLQGIPPNFSFAFEMPDGAPAGEGIEFPPVTHPYVLDRGNGRYLVMCYRVSPSGPDALNVSPARELANVLTNTSSNDYAKADDMLEINIPMRPDLKQRYMSFVSKRDRIGVQAFLNRIGNGQFFYGNAEIEKPDLAMVIYLPEQKISEALLSLQRASELLIDWNK